MVREHVMSKMPPMMNILLVLLSVVVATISCREEQTAPSTTADPRLREQLQSLGYIDFSDVAGEDSVRSGVTRHNPDRSFPGYNLYNTRTANRARLVTMDGEIVHEWFHPELEGTWHHIEMAAAGDLLVVAKGGYVARLDWDSRILWKTVMNAHHDVAIRDNGTTYTLGREMVDVPLGPVRVPIVNDSIDLLSSDGEVLQSVFLYELLKDRLPRLRMWKNFLARWMRRGDGEVTRYDLFHTNTLEIVDSDLAGLPTQNGFLICVRELDLVAILDSEVKRVLWSWGPGELDRPHHPSVTREGRILIFDNAPGFVFLGVARRCPGAAERERSRDGLGDRACV